MAGRLGALRSLNVHMDICDMDIKVKYDPVEYLRFECGKCGYDLVITGLDTKPVPDELTFDNVVLDNSKTVTTFYLECSQCGKGNVKMYWRSESGITIGRYE